MPDKIKRYFVNAVGDDGGWFVEAEENKYGDWVKYEDIKRLLYPEERIDYIPPGYNVGG